MTGNSEDEIIVRARAGDCDAFCELVERYKQRPLRLAYSFCANYEDAKDLSQEAFIKAFKTIKNFRGNSKFYTWFYRILVNICRDYLRRKRRNRIVSCSVRFRVKDDEVEPEDIFESVASGAPGPKQLLLDKELAEQLTEAISSLPGKQRIVFTLKNVHGLTIEEIAEITECASGTIKAHLFKASTSLQVKLEGYIS